MKKKKKKSTVKSAIGNLEFDGAICELLVAPDGGISDTRLWILCMMR